MRVCKFPETFLWGVATSAYQIEGATDADGRGESIWDRFCRQPGAIKNGHTGDSACEHYYRWRDDVALMRELHLNSYRFSVAWPRVFPDGGGALNSEGMGFYDRLVDELLSSGIRPLVTLYHWDLPAALQDKGGWAHRDTAFRFRDYAAVMFERLGDRVDLWVTVNEPWVAAMLGHYHGWHAPGVREAATAVQAGHHLLLAHGLAVEVFDDLGLRSGARSTASTGAGRIGISLDIHAYDAVSGDPRDRAAMERARTLEARWFIEPLVGRGYPEEALEWYATHHAAPMVMPGDMEQMARPFDFLGINYYRRHVIAEDHMVPLFGYRQVMPDGPPVTGMNWEVFPQGLHEVLQWVWDTYVRPLPGRFLLVTENGAAYPDVVASDEAGPRICDASRLKYLESHLYQVWRAIDRGIPVHGYYAWSLLDNFEWAQGYSQRFGVVHVDFQTQSRIVKDSGRWYAGVARANALSMTS